jgi:hypothetical protein
MNTMLRRKICRIASISALLMLTIVGLAPAGSQSPAHPTKVLTFYPAVPTGRARSGSCWTDSIADNRRGAWRCMGGNEIYDPCFETPRLSGGVICGADPVANVSGFILKLTEPLPAPSSRAPSDPLPWLLKLADGSVCQSLGGNANWVNGKALPYGCSDSRGCSDSDCSYQTGITDDLVRRKKIWIAEKIAFTVSSDGKTTLLKHEWIAVEAAWK